MDFVFGQAQGSSPCSDFAGSVDTHAGWEMRNGQPLNMRVCGALRQVDEIWVSQ